MDNLKQYTTLELWDEYEKASDKEKIQILKNALGYMQQYNGRSQSDCIFMAMGYDMSRTEDNRYVKAY